MKRHIKYSSIGQYRNIVKSIQMTTQFAGLDKDCEPIFNKNIPSPVLQVTASEKIHGTNAAVSFSSPDGFWVQSRSNIITPEKDNAGCAFQADQNKDKWMHIVHALAEEYNVDLFDQIITIYFEWAGGTIQKNSACTGLDKQAIIFQHFKVSPLEQSHHYDDPGEEDIASYWLETKTIHGWLSSPDDGIYNIMDYEVYTFPIDFEKAQLHQNNMIELVNLIEAESPFGKAFGKTNIGEGIVCTVEFGGKVHKFKIKGEKHSKSKVKTLKPVDEAKENAKIEFANYACSASRLEQAWQLLFGIDNEKFIPDIKFTGNFIREVIRDVIKEEMDILAEKKLEPKEVNAQIGKLARMWFMEELDKQAGI